MSEPLFKIGDLVTTKAHMAARGEKGWSFGGPIVGQIIEMFETTCYAGMQRSYGVRFATRDTLTHTGAVYSEPELVPYTPPPPEAE